MSGPFDKFALTESEAGFIARALVGRSPDIAARESGNAARGAVLLSREPVRGALRELAARADQLLQSRTT